MVIMVDIWGSNDSDILWYVSFDRWYCTPQVKIIKESINPGYYSSTIPSGGKRQPLLDGLMHEKPTARLQGCRNLHIQIGEERWSGNTSRHYQWTVSTSAAVSWEHATLDPFLFLLLWAVTSEMEESHAAGRNDKTLIFAGNGCININK